MLLKVLGAAAGGGIPQWNCNCRYCQLCRRPEGKHQVIARTQSSLAIAAPDGRWVIVNASPDIHQQLQRWLPRPQNAGPRWSPVAAVILTDSQIDHCAGLLLLREANTPLPIYCTDPVAADLTTTFPVLTMLGSYAGVDLRRLSGGGEKVVIPELGGIEIIALPMQGKAPPYSEARSRPAAQATIALVLRDPATGGSAVYAPGIASVPATLRPYLAAADVLLVDGTCWHDDDLQRAGCGTRRARQMGHMPLAGPDGLLAELALYPKARRLLVHINNTNPILDEASSEHLELKERSIEIAIDGTEVRC